MHIAFDLDVPTTSTVAFGRTMNWDLIAARWALGEMTAEDLTEVAVDALLEGHDSAPLRLLAGELNPTMAEVGALFEEALAHESVAVPSVPHAVFELAKHTAALLLAGCVDPLEGARRIACLGHEIAFFLAEFGLLSGLESQHEDFTSPHHIAYYGEERCAEVREETVMRIRATAQRLLAMGQPQLVQPP